MTVIVLFISVEAGYHLFTCEEASSEVDQLLINTEPVDIVKVSIIMDRLQRQVQRCESSRALVLMSGFTHYE